MKIKILGNKAAIGWIIALVTFLVVTNLIRGTVIRHQKLVIRPESASKPYQPYPVVQKVIFPEGIDRQEFDLNPNGWFQVITPVGSKFRIDSPPDTDIWFLNGQKVKDGPYEANWVGIKVGNDVFWMRGKGRASVTIARIKR